ncbi:MAG: S8 family serine peptidase [Brumimicrobium sp.]|nr:S8 family serine peptidase [Brumimicrobium sp.]MCO5267417.1 S8 family peptidase [Brumimicrobium sp.]
MRKLFLRIILPVFMGTFFTTSYAQVDKGVLNWYNSSKTGMSTDAAYKLLKKQTPETVVVAIIDSGVDINHEDLQGKIWTNTKEIPGNGIDDDGNGYIDDIHGWNFLGNANGENQDHARLEKTRIYADLKPRFENVEAADVSAEDQEDYALYVKVRDDVEGEMKEYKDAIDQTKQFRDQMLPMLPSMIANMMGVKEMTEKSLNKWKTTNGQEAQMKRLGLMIVRGELNEALFDEQLKQIESMLNYHLNVDYDDRAIIGDDPMDINDRNYGNNDVKGVGSDHGTHVSGIVSAIRGNKLGGDGVANNVLIMSLRSVPDGDEFDKDIALAIRYAVDNGAKVINGSFGKSYSPLQKDVYEAIMYAQDHDVLFVHAAGNDNKDLAVEDNFPAVQYSFQKEPFTHVLTIGASTRFTKGNLAADFSNYGANQVDIFAPGYEIYNTWPENNYKKIQGTSMAAPMVAGVAAMLKGYFPSLSMLEIKDIILESGNDFGDTEQVKPGTEEKVKFSTLSKTGKTVNVLAAVKLAQQKIKAKAAQ